MGGDDRILARPWPPDLHPAWARFRRRTETILRRDGIWDDMTRLDDVTVAEVLGWENAGAGTVADLREKANTAIAIHLEVAEEDRQQTNREAAVRRREAEEIERRLIEDRLVRLAAQPWTAQVWRRDPRFTPLFPARFEVRTVRDLAVRGTEEEKRLLWGIADGVEARVARLAALPLDVAVTGYVEAISSQHGVRLEMLLACTGLARRDVIPQREAAVTLEVTHQRMSQIVAQLYRRRDRVAPPNGIWMPQVDTAIVDGWPNGYTQAGIDATGRFLHR